jgi:DNA-binding IclR family transcriptional regulator
VSDTERIATGGVDAADERQQVASPAVAHAVRIMEYLARSTSEARLSQIARDVGLSKSSCLNILTTLVSMSMLTRDGDAPRYRLGPKLLELARGAQRGTSQRAVIAEELEPLLEQARANCIIYQRLAQNDGFVIIDKIEPRLSDGENPPSPSVGKVYSLFSPALGGAYLATLTDEEIADLVVASGRPVDEYYFLDRIEYIRKVGFAWSEGDYEGVRAITTVLPNSDPQLIICLVANQFSNVPSNIETWGKELVVSTQRIAEKLRSQRRS